MFALNMQIKFTAYANVSIVLYKNPFEQTKNLIHALQQSELIRNIYIIDNSPQPSDAYKNNYPNYIFTGKNLGYGTGHNLALRISLNSNLPYHLIINPDITL